MEQIKPDTPLVYLTVEQFTSLLQKLLMVNKRMGNKEEFIENKNISIRKRFAPVAQ